MAPGNKLHDDSYSIEDSDSERWEEVAIEKLDLTPVNGGEELCLSE
jgi:hypothetical protein